LKLCSIALKNVKCFTAVYIHSAVTKQTCRKS
jgi:hypothetical protein